MPLSLQGRATWSAPSSPHTNNTTFLPLFLSLSGSLSLSLSLSFYFSFSAHPQSNHVTQSPTGHSDAEDPPPPPTIPLCLSHPSYLTPLFLPPAPPPLCFSVFPNRVALSHSQLISDERNVREIQMWVRACAHAREWLFPRPTLSHPGALQAAAVVVGYLKLLSSCQGFNPKLI